jgi:hypothetical protein
VVNKHRFTNKEDSVAMFNQCTHQLIGLLLKMRMPGNNRILLQIKPKDVHYVPILKKFGVTNHSLKVDLKELSLTELTKAIEYFLI